MEGGIIKKLGFSRLLGIIGIVWVFSVVIMLLLLTGVIKENDTVVEVGY